MGGEYKSLLPYLSTHDILRRFSCPYTHQQNGVSEWKHCHITEIGLTLIFHAKLLLTFWQEAFVATTFLINNLPSPTLYNTSSFEKLYHKPLNYSYLQTSYYSCFPYLRYYNKHKLAFHTTKCIFLVIVLFIKDINAFIQMAKFMCLDMSSLMKLNFLFLSCSLNLLH